jgi:hypothetical protein
MLPALDSECSSPSGFGQQNFFCPKAARAEHSESGQHENGRRKIGLAQFSLQKDRALNFNPKQFAPLGVTEPIDVLLADIAISVQLSKTEHDKAVARFETMQDWIDRKASPLHGLVRLMYPQGSMAIGATIARVSDKEEYDVDAIVDLNIPVDADPQVVLDTLFEAIRGEKGSRYYDMTIRHTRCVCVSYEDGMHIDLTPAVLLALKTPRTSTIFHSKPEDPEVEDRRLFANPWGLAEWFKEKTSKDEDFARYFEKRSLAYDGKLMARAPAEPVPDQEPAYHKSRALIALQLIKRWRNVLFARRDRSRLRRPPSVLLSKLIAENANRTRTLSEEVEHQAACILARLEYEKSCANLIYETNPRCPDDVLTDRWPASRADQDLMIADLRDFVAKMQVLRRGDLSLAQMGKILEGLFGERPAKKVVDEYVTRSAPGGNRIVPATGRVIGAASGLMTPAAARPSAAHNFYGD